MSRRPTVWRSPLPGLSKVEELGDRPAGLQVLHDANQGLTRFVLEGEELLVLTDLQLTTAGTIYIRWNDGGEE